jgi:hypothetical protein
MKPVLKVPNSICIKVFNIDFKYTTRRKNERSRCVEIRNISKEDAELSFWGWILSENEKKSFRAYSNVNILDISEVDFEVYEI